MTCALSPQPRPAPSDAVVTAPKAPQLKTAKVVHKPPASSRIVDKSKPRKKKKLLWGMRQPQPTKQIITQRNQRLRALVHSDSAFQAIRTRLNAYIHGWDWFSVVMPIHGDEAARIALQTTFAAELKVCRKPFLALTLTALGQRANKWFSVRRRAQVMMAMRMLTGAEAARLATTLFARPALAQALRQAYAVQERIELYHRGDSLATFLRFVRTFDDAPAALPHHEIARALVADMDAKTADTPEGLAAGWEAHGRTLHFVENGQDMGLKLQKLSDDALTREDVMNRAVAQLKAPLALKSDFPRSLGLLQFTPTESMRAAVAQQAMYQGESRFSIGDTDTVTALLYAAPKGYHVHLHEVGTLKALQTASNLCLHDAGVLAGRAGLINRAPADLYHNREKDRRYYWNVDQVGKAVGRRLGAGRLDRWEAAIRTINLGPTGLRDLKHYAFYGDVAEDYQGRPRLALTSALGDVLLAWSLSVGKWFVDHDRLDDVTAIQQTMRQGFVTFFSAYTGRSNVASEAFLKALVDWKLISEQMQYFMSHAYVQDVAQHKVKKGICGPHARVEVKIPAEGWDNAHGWRLDGINRDLGPKNGPFPPTELVAALYLTTAFAVQLRQA